MLDLEDVIYLDNNATTPVDSRVLSAMLPFFSNNFGNASSSHHLGSSVNQVMKSARFEIANFIGADMNEIVFTSGSTEAINIALKGVAESYLHKGKHIITVSTEHHAVLDTCKHLESKGYEVTYLAVDEGGLISLPDLKKYLRTDTILVCVMMINNETGVIQPIKEIASLTHESGALFMTDTTQAVGKIKINVDDLGIDLLCMSGHKIYGPKGVGALYVRRRNNRITLPTFLHGGGHEQGLRSGTLNVPGIIALAKACEIARQEMAEDELRISELRNELEGGLLKIPGAFINGNKNNRIYNVTNICFPGIDANILIARMKNVAVSNGSACSAAVIEPSHVLQAMGLSEGEAFGSIRFSLGRFNTREEIIKAVEIMNVQLKLVSSALT